MRIIASNTLTWLKILINLKSPEKKIGALAPGSWQSHSYNGILFIDIVSYVNKFNYIIRRLGLALNKINHLILWGPERSQNLEYLPQIFRGVPNLEAYKV